MIDLHVHTESCRHATGAVSDYVDAARARGLEVIAFTDHLPLLDADDTDYAMSRPELPAYVDAVREAARASAAPEVLIGIEADWHPGRESDTRELLDSLPLDVVLGSVHFIDGWAFDDPRERAPYERWDVDELYERYFGDFVTAAQTGLFDVMAHPDLIKKFDVRPDREPTELFERVAEAIASAGVAIEVSTAGLRKPCREIYPSSTLLRAFYRAGVPATIGSDAHAPSEVGHACEEAANLLRECGYRNILVFRDREGTGVPL
jgi:histidinol-phosphatase (PHP family)